MGGQPSAEIKSPLDTTGIERNAAGLLRKTLQEKFLIDPENNTQTFKRAHVPRVVFMQSPFMNVKPVRDRLHAHRAFIVSNGVDGLALNPLLRDSTDGLCFIDIAALYYENRAKNTVITATETIATSMLDSTVPHKEIPPSLMGFLLQHMTLSAALRNSQLSAAFFIKNSGFNVDNADEYRTVCHVNLASYVGEKKQQMLDAINYADDEWNALPSNTSVDASAAAAAAATPQRAKTTQELLSDEGQMLELIAPGTRRFNYDRTGCAQCELFIGDAKSTALLCNKLSLCKIRYGSELKILATLAATENLVVQQLYPPNSLSLGCEGDDNLYVFFTLSKKWYYAITAILLELINASDAELSLVLRTICTMLEVSQKILEEKKKRGAHVLQFHFDIPVFFGNNSIEALRLLHCPSVFVDALLTEPMSLICSELCIKLTLIVEDLIKQKRKNFTANPMLIQNLNNRFFVFTPQERFTFVRIGDLPANTAAGLPVCLRDQDAELAFYSPHYIQATIETQFNSIFSAAAPAANSTFVPAAVATGPSGNTSWKNKKLDRLLALYPDYEKFFCKI